MKIFSYFNQIFNLMSWLLIIIISDFIKSFSVYPLFCFELTDCNTPKLFYVFEDILFKIII